MEPKTTSKTSSLKALLLRAWRERWTDLQWGIQIKTVLPRGVSGDVYDLADCIVRQATVGRGANRLVVSYLRHSLQAQLVSHAAVLRRVAKFDAFDARPHCALDLLEFVEGVLDAVACRGRLEEGALVVAVLAIVRWLVRAHAHAARPGTTAHELLRDKPTTLLGTIVDSPFLMAMLYLAKRDTPEQYEELVEECRGLEADRNSPIERALDKLKNLEPDAFAPIDADAELKTHCVQPLLVIELLVNPNADTQTFVSKLQSVGRIKGYTMARLYCETMRGSLLALEDAEGSPSRQSTWGAFTFLKVPQIIHKLRTDREESADHDPDVVDAFEILIMDSPLLDRVDLNCSCNCIRSLLEGLAKLTLATEQHVARYSRLREPAEPRPQKFVPGGLQGSIPTFIMRAEPTLAGILKTMSADFTKIQDALQSMLCQVLGTKSLDVILAVASVEGKLKQFASKLIKFNERSLEGRPVLFDVTFLILCSIVQQYGAEAVVEEDGDSFFERWARDCPLERGALKSPDAMLQKCDASKVEALLRQLNAPTSPEHDAKLKCHELCVNACGAIKETLYAWEHGSLGSADVRRILDAARQKMASLAVCASAWLCSYVRIVDQDSLLKPMNMLQQFLTPLGDAELAMSDSFKERSMLMFQIVRKMQHHFRPPAPSKSGAAAQLSHGMVSKQPISERLHAAWENAMSKGWLRDEWTQMFESLYNTGGAVWFVGELVKQALTFRHDGDLSKTVDYAFALFHFDIERCTQALLLQILPQYLYNKMESDELLVPQVDALAALSVYCIYAALEFTNAHSPSASGSRKRSRFEDAEDIEALCPTNKVRRLNDNTTESSTMFASSLPSSQSSESSVALKEPLASALQELFKVFMQLAVRDSEVSPQPHFIFRFLECAVQCGRDDRARIVLQGMPGELVPTLVKALPERFTTGLILRLYDLNSTSGRKSTARDLCLLRNMQLRPK